jgi:ribokinase
MAVNTEIIVVGSHAPGLFLRVKKIPLAGETVIGWDFQEPKDGGKGSNQAIAAALLGGKVSFVGCVGNDRVGLEGEIWMREVGVDTAFLRKHASVSSSVGFNLLDENGIPAMVTSFGANAEITRDQIIEAFSHTPNAKVMLTQFEIPLDIALFAIEQASKIGLIPIINPAPAMDISNMNLGANSILVPNESEAQILLGLTIKEDFSEEKIIKGLKEKFGLEKIIVTLGGKGIIGLDSSGIWRISSPKVSVVDTSGAGDVFCAALAVGIVKGKDIRSASDWACTAASLSVTKSGTIPSFPTLKEVSNFLKINFPNNLGIAEN